jgi:magnesium-transporting ATPase (P-type)
MKNLLTLPLSLLLGLFILGCGCNSKASTNQNTSEENTATTQQTINGANVPENRVELYYFHATRRCPTCTHAEAYIEKALEEYYSSEVARKQLVYRAVNFEKSENRPLAERFQIPFNGLVINVVKGSEENHFFVKQLFQKVHKGEQPTIDFLKETIDKELNNL